MNTEPDEPRRPDCMIMVYNVGKIANVGNMVRSAVAFGASSIVIVGNRKIQTFGNQNTTGYLQEIHYDTIEEARASLKSKGYTIIGVEIGNGAADISTHPFDGDTVFMFGNEGQGFNEKQYEVCDKLVYIPQYGRGTASLNVSNAAAIILHHFALWAQYKEQTIVNAKFLVDKEAKVFQKRIVDGKYQYTVEDLELKAARQAKRQAVSESIDSAPPTDL